MNTYRLIVYVCPTCGERSNGLICLHRACLYATATPKRVAVKAA